MVWENKANVWGSYRGQLCPPGLGWGAAGGVGEGSWGRGGFASCGHGRGGAKPWILAHPQTGEGKETQTAITLLQWTTKIIEYILVIYIYI